LLLRNSVNFCQAWCAGRFEGVSKYSFTYSLFILRDAPEQNFRGGESALRFRSAICRVCWATLAKMAALRWVQSRALVLQEQSTIPPWTRSCRRLRDFCAAIYTVLALQGAPAFLPGVSVAQEISRPTVCANYVQGRGSLNFSLPAAPPRSQNQSDGEASILIAQPAATAPPRAWRLASWPARPTRRTARAPSPGICRFPAPD
jgi:hypothetical protein